MKPAIAPLFIVRARLMVTSNGTCRKGSTGKVKANFLRRSPKDL